MLFDDDDVEEVEKVSFTIFDREQIEHAAFNYYRKTGFPYRNLPLHVMQQELNKLAALPVSEKLLQHVAGYQIADTFHKHRFSAAAHQMKSPVESFGIDKSLKRAIKLKMDHTQRVGTELFGEMTLVSGTQACSNFRPAFAMLLYKTYANRGDTVLDTSTGYGGRLVGFMASQLEGTYIGIDPNTETHEANLGMASALGFADHVELINLPAEDVNPELLRERCDFAFTSPPYFKKERYSDDDTQSWVRYGHDATVWRDKFLRRMLHLQYVALKPDSYNIVNIAPVKIGKEIYPLDEWTIEAGTDVGFKYLETRRFILSPRFGANMNEEAAFEPVIIFKKE